MNILAFCAHPDDIELNVGGTLLIHGYRPDFKVLPYGRVRLVATREGNVVRKCDCAGGIAGCV